MVTQLGFKPTPCPSIHILVHLREPVCNGAGRRAQIILCNLQWQLMSSIQQPENKLRSDTWLQRGHLENQNDLFSPHQGNFSILHSLTLPLAFVHQTLMKAPRCARQRNTRTKNNKQALPSRNSRTHKLMEKADFFWGGGFNQKDLGSLKTGLFFPGCSFNAFASSSKTVPKRTISQEL